MPSTVPEPSPPPAERAAPLGLITDALAHSVTGSADRAPVVVVEGEAGVGKSALLAAAARSATDRRCSSVRADSLDRHVPFSLLHRILGALTALPGAETVLREPSAAVLAPAMDAVGLVGRLDRDAHEAVLAVGVTWLIGRLADDGPLLLVVDDAHLADEASLAVLGSAWRRVDRATAALLIGVRPPAACPAPIGALRAVAEVVTLRPLTPEGTARLLAAEHVEVPEADARVLHALTRGRPSDLMRMVRDAGGPGAADLVAAAVARAVREVGSEARWTLEVLAVVDTVDDPDDLGRIRPSASDAAAVVEELRDAGLVAPDHPVRCAHPQVAVEVRRDMAPDDLATLHRAALTVALDSGASPERLVALALGCPPAGDPVVVDILSAESGRAIRAARPDRALELLRRALREPPVPERTVALRGQMALASALADEPGAPMLVRRAALELGGVAGAQLARRASWIISGNGRTRDAIALIDDLRAGLASADCEVADVLDAGWLAAARLDVTCLPLLRRRVAEAATTRRFDPTPTGRSLAGLVAYELCLQGRDRRRVVELARHALDADTGHTPTTDLSTVWSAVLSLQFADEFDVAADALDRLERRGIARGRDEDVFAALHLLSSIERHRGRLGAAEAAATRVADALAEGWRGRHPGAAGSRCRLALLADDVERAERELVIPGGPEAFRDDPSLVEFLDARGHLRFRQGRFADALDDHLTVRDRHDALGVRNTATILWPVGAARAMAALGRRPEALDLLDEHLLHARAWGAPRAIGALLTTIGALRADRDGDAALDEAVAVLDGTESIIELAEAHLAVAELAGRRGDARRAERAARQAEVGARRAGAVAIAARAVAVLTDLGVTGEAPRGGPRLTPAELRAARMAADGATNAQIAAALFVTRKAVEYHLSNAYRKLGVAGRRDLAAALTDHDT